MRLSGYLFGLLVGMFLAVGAVIVVTEFAAEDSGFLLEGSESAENSTRFKTFNSSFNQFAALNSSVGALKSSTNDFTSSNPLEFAGALFRTGYNSVRTVFGSFAFMGDMLGASQEIFGIDGRLVGFGMVAVTLVIIFAVLAAIFQTDV